MTRTPFSFAHIIAFCAPLAVVASCGKGTEAVTGSAIQMHPANIGQATTLGFAGENAQSYTINVMSPSGYPEIGTHVRVMSQYLVYEGQYTYAEILALGLSPVALPYENTTDTNGNINITVRYNWPAAISGDFTAFEAWSGTDYGNSTITFTCTDPDTATDPACP